MDPDVLGRLPSAVFHLLRMEAVLFFQADMLDPAAAEDPELLL
ncbi:hypothetical protein [Bacillus sp. JCM 19041]